MRETKQEYQDRVLEQSIKNGYKNMADDQTERLEKILSFDSGKEALEYARAQHIRKVKLIQAIAESLSDSTSDRLDSLIRQFLPHGSGIDGTNSIDDKSTPAKIIVNSEYHFMDDNGFYAGWFEFRITWIATFKGSDIRFQITSNGTDKKRPWLIELFEDYLCETFDYSMSQEISHSWNKEQHCVEYLRLEVSN